MNKNKLLMVLLSSIFMTGCHKNYYVGLYKDEIQRDCLLAIFPSAFELEVAMDNCKAAVALNEADDRRNPEIDIITGGPTVYYCQEIPRWNI